MALSGQIEGALRGDPAAVPASTFNDEALLLPLVSPEDMRTLSFMAGKLLDRQRRERVITMEEFNLFSEMLGLEAA
jgi:hypothetical protein